ncbi:MAG: hypothetical protein OQK51_25425 [Kangiellaceae bacterium]|nr:hypothetical protein [Kangiellaceae bacterium]
MAIEAGPDETDIIPQSYPQLTHTHPDQKANNKELQANIPKAFLILRNP